MNSLNIKIDYAGVENVLLSRCRCQRKKNKTTNTLLLLLLLKEIIRNSITSDLFCNSFRLKKKKITNSTEKTAALTYGSLPNLVKLTYFNSYKQ